MAAGMGPAGAGRGGWRKDPEKRHEISFVWLVRIKWNLVSMASRLIMCHWRGSLNIKFPRAAAAAAGNASRGCAGD